MTTDIRAWEKHTRMCTSGQCLRTRGLTDTAIHWTPEARPQDKCAFPAMEGLESNVVMKCRCEKLQVSVGELRKKTDIDV